MSGTVRDAGGMPAVAACRVMAVLLLVCIFSSSNAGAVTGQAGAAGHAMRAQVDAPAITVLPRLPRSALPPPGIPGRLVWCTDCRRPAASDTSGDAFGAPMVDDGASWTPLSGAPPSR